MSHHKGLVFLLWATLIVLVIGIIRGERSIGNYFELQHSRDVLKKRVDSLQTENTHLSREILKITKSKSYAKKVLRDKYHITDEDEKIVFFAD